MTAAMIELKGVSSGYGKKTVLSDVTASFARGSLTSVIGLNGCGKSTLLKTVLGIMPFSYGEILLDGQNLNSMTRVEIAKKCAYLSQGKDTPDMTVEQLVLHGRFPHLSYPRRYRKRDMEIARAAMAAVGISELAEKSLCTLSGGMRQNAYIAMALAQDTDYILLDEPTTYLDIPHQLDLMRLLKRLSDEGRGIVTVMHDLPLAFDFSDRICVIDKGTVRAQASPNDLSRDSVIQELFKVQLKTAYSGKYYCNTQC